MAERHEKRIFTRTGLSVPVISSLIAFVLIAGITVAWLYNRNNVATVLPVEPPSDVKILGPHGNDNFQLDLSYGSEDVDSNNQVTVRKVFCVESDQSKQKLEVIHTTNLDNLAFKIYAATELGDGVTAPAGANTVQADGYTYSYSNTPIAGDYINKTTGSSNSHLYADDTFHNRNYDSYENVQTHVEPLYWISGEQNSGTTSSVTKGYRQYYVIEITWKEEIKETDIFYLLAQGIS